MAEERAVQVRKFGPVGVRAVPVAEEAGQVGAAERVVGNRDFAGGQWWVVIFNGWDGRAQGAAAA